MPSPAEDHPRRPAWSHPACPARRRRPCRVLYRLQPPRASRVQVHRLDLRRLLVHCLPVPRRPLPVLPRRLRLLPLPAAVPVALPQGLQARAHPRVPVGLQAQVHLRLRRPLPAPHLVVHLRHYRVPCRLRAPRVRPPPCHPHRPAALLLRSLRDRLARHHPPCRLHRPAPLQVPCRRRAHLPFRAAHRAVARHPCRAAHHRRVLPVCLVRLRRPCLLLHRRLDLAPLRALCPPPHLRLLQVPSQAEVRPLHPA